jgi:hypothetical protein
MRKLILVALGTSMAIALWMNFAGAGRAAEQAEGGVPTWNGLFRHASGGYDLRLQRLDRQATQVDLVKANQPWESEGAHFYALISGDTAEFKKAGCTVSLAWVAQGVEIQDSCSGSAGSNGLYRRLAEGSRE